MADTDQEAEQRKTEQAETVGAAPDTGKPVAPEAEESRKKSRKSLLTHLNEIKELILIIVFFLGGVAWIYSAFATKQHVESVRCLLEATIQRIDLEGKARIWRGELIGKTVEIRLLEEREVLDIIRIETLKADVKDLERQKKAAAERASEAAQRLVQGGCFL